MSKWGFHISEVACRRGWPDEAAQIQVSVMVCTSHVHETTRTRPSNAFRVIEFIVVWIGTAHHCREEKGTYVSIPSCRCRVRLLVGDAGPAFRICRTTGKQRVGDRGVLAEEVFWSRSPPNDMSRTRALWCGRASPIQISDRRSEAGGGNGRAGVVLSSLVCVAR